MTAAQIYKKAEALGGIVNKRTATIDFPNPVQLKTHSMAIDMLDVAVAENSDNINIATTMNEPTDALRAFLVREKKHHEKK